MADVDVVVPTFNQSSFTEACAASLARHTPAGALRILWVDNGSAPEEYDRAAAAWAATGFDVVAVRLPANVGFVKATNVGIAIATAPLLCFLNNDTEVPPGWLARLRAVLDTNPRIGIVGPRSSNPTENAGAVPEAPGFRIQRRGDMIAFFCALMRRELIARFGYLNETFGMGLGDDDEYCRRLQENGYELALVTDLTVTHHSRTTFNAVFGKDGWKKAQRANRAILDGKAPPAPGAPAVIVTPPRTMAAMATIPRRAHLVGEALRSLRPQVTKLHVVCNGYAEPPDVVRELADEWVCVPGNDDGAMAKLRWSHSWGGLYLTCDDDIRYPADYEAVMRQWVRRWRGKAIVTFHGRTLAPRCRDVNHVVGGFIGCFGNLPHPGRWINYPGSGVSGWDTRLRVPSHFADGANNEEAHLAVWAQQHRVPIFAAPHPLDWLVDLTAPDEPALWKNEKADQWRRPNAVVVPFGRSRGWQVYRAA